VRPLRNGRPHSGCPFRQAIEHDSGVCPGSRYACIGIQRQSNSPLLLRFMEENRAVYYTLEDCTGDQLLEHALQEARRIRAETDSLMLTVDLDSIRAADAPGVSAPSPVGLYADQVMHVVQALLKERLPTSLDVAEVNPQFDIDHRTARLAALFVYQALAV
jgi:formiminoglutamase